MEFEEKTEKNGGREEVSWPVAPVLMKLTLGRSPRNYPKTAGIEFSHRNERKFYEIIEIYSIEIK